MHRAAGGSWSEVADLAHTRTANSFAEQVVVADDGSITASWQLAQFDPGGVIQAAHLAPGGYWTAPVDVTELAMAPDPGSSRSRARRAGQRDGSLRGWVGDARQVEAATLDTTGPAVDAFTSPAGVAGKALFYNASATDQWSSVASYSWKFGDGASVSGAAPSHAYVAPGSYLVTLTVTDSVGNKTTRTATTTVSEATAPPPPPVAQQPPAITLFEVKDPKIQALSAGLSMRPPRPSSRSA